MKTAIIVPTYNRPALVERMLKSLADCEFPPDVEILIAENGKRAGTKEICEGNPIGGRVRYHFIESAGRSGALNSAIRSSDADFFIFFDDDLTFPKNIISTYVSAAERYGPGNFFGGPLIADVEIKCPSHLVPYLPPSSKDWTLGDTEIDINLDHVDMFFGANWGAFRSDLKKVGYFAEDLGVSASRLSPLGEETAVQYDLLKSGARGKYLPSAVIYHLVQKECYTIEWIRNRKARHGVTDFLVHHKNARNVKKFFGIPLWVIRALFEEYFRLIIGKLLSSSVEDRTKSKMRISYLSGIIYGALTNMKKTPSNSTTTTGSQVEDLSEANFYTNGKSGTK
jgi:glycosyltransferase involved in cell wall biosynthesis